MRRSRADGTASERIVLGALVFSAAAMRGDTASIAAAAVATALYVWLVDLGNGAGEEHVPASGASDP
jgi:hypothetical protein